jgi:hypothetical protein
MITAEEVEGKKYYIGVPCVRCGGTERYVNFGRCRQCMLKTTKRTQERRGKIYSVWATMKQRCCNPNVEYYHLYGGKGIRVCDRWLNSFENFISDMGERPTPKHSIERVDSNGDYSPDNCKWATIKEQACNTRKVKEAKYYSFHKGAGKWCAKTREKHIGSFNTEKEAAEAVLLYKQALTKNEATNE